MIHAIDSRHRCAETSLLSRLVRPQLALYAKLKRHRLHDNGVCATYGPLHFRQLAAKDAISHTLRDRAHDAQWCWNTS